MSPESSLITVVKSRSYSYQPSIKWGNDRKQLKEAMKSLYGFGGKRIEPVGSISLLVSFGSLKNTRTKFVTFDLVNMHHPYSAIFGIGFLNTFEAALHSVYLYLKVPSLLGVISVHSSQKDARNIEQSFTLRHRAHPWPKLASQAK
jgi:hypothetical protein